MFKVAYSSQGARSWHTLPS